MSEPSLLDLPIHPCARVVLSPHVWERILGVQHDQWADVPPFSVGAEHGRREAAVAEILNWERAPDRGVLHDPPEKWYPITLKDYFARREAWIQDEEVPWLRSQARLSAWAENVGMVAYAVNIRGRGPAAALLLWMIDNDAGKKDGCTEYPVRSVAYVPDIIWDPGTGIRNAGRYLLQELYLRHPDALAVVDMVPASSALNHVLMALGYRVYQRWGVPESGQ